MTAARFLHRALLLILAVSLPASITAEFPDTREPNMTLVFTGGPGSGANPLPTSLSSEPDLFTVAKDQGHLVPGVIPYEPSAELWSDNTGKMRYVAVPGLGQVAVEASGAWTWPNQTLMIKNFTIALDERSPETTSRRIETRLLLKQTAGWQVFTYQWNPQETDATLVHQSGANLPLTIIEADGTTLNYTWRFPSRNQCFSCHTTAADFVLGPLSGYLNHDFVYPEKTEPMNQVDAWRSVSMFSPPLPPASELDAIPDHQDTSATLTARAKSYLASNCAYCHQPGGGPNLSMDHRWEKLLAEMNIVDVVPQRNKLGVSDARIVYSGEPDKSVLLLRMETTNTNNRMPPVGTTRVDPEGTAMVRQWIESLGIVPTVQRDVWYIE